MSECTHGYGTCRNACPECAKEDMIEDQRKIFNENIQRFVDIFNGILAQQAEQKRERYKTDVRKKAIKFQCDV